MVQIAPALPCAFDFEPARPGLVVIDKPGKGAFHAAPLIELLTGPEVSTLFFAGVTTDVCVQSAMRGANDRGFDCLPLEGASDS